MSPSRHARSQRNGTRAGACAVASSVIVKPAKARSAGKRPSKRGAALVLVTVNPPSAIAPRSTLHLQPRAAEESFDGVEIDDQRHAFALRIAAALDLVRAFVHEAPRVRAVVDVRAAAERHEAAVVRIEVAVDQGHRGILADGPEHSALRIAHPDRKLRGAVRLRAAAVRELRRAALVDIS